MSNRSSKRSKRSARSSPTRSSRSTTTTSRSSEISSTSFPPLPSSGSAKTGGFEIPTNSAFPWESSDDEKLLLSKCDWVTAGVRTVVRASALTSNSNSTPLPSSARCTGSQRLDTDEPWFSEPHPQVQNCTGVAADWCDTHGQCTCSKLDMNGREYVKWTVKYNDGRVRTSTKTDCPLHGNNTDHPLEDIYGDHSYDDETSYPWDDPRSDPMGDLLLAKEVVLTNISKAYAAGTRASDVVDAMYYALGATFAPGRKTRIIPEA